MNAVTMATAPNCCCRSCSVAVVVCAMAAGHTKSNTKVVCLLFHVARPAALRVCNSDSRRVNVSSCFPSTNNAKQQYSAA